MEVTDRSLGLCDWSLKDVIVQTTFSVQKPTLTSQISVLDLVYISFEQSLQEKKKINKKNPIKSFLDTFVIFNLIICQTCCNSQRVYENIICTRLD